MAKILDIEGNVYNTVTFNTQEWTVENWKCTTLNDGNTIPQLTANSDWSTTTDPAYCYYDNDINTYKVYGKLYNWAAVNGLKVPDGWIVPTDADWDILGNYLIANGYNYDGSTTGNKIAKSLASKSNFWASSTAVGAIGNNLTTNNFSCMSSLPSSLRDNDGTFGAHGGGAFWWSATESNASAAWYRGLIYSFELLSRSTSTKNYGLSVRLVRRL